MYSVESKTTTVREIREQKVFSHLCRLRFEVAVEFGEGLLVASELRLVVRE